MLSRSIWHPMWLYKTLPNSIWAKCYRFYLALQKIGQWTPSYKIPHYNLQILIRKSICIISTPARFYQSLQLSLFQLFDISFAQRLNEHQLSYSFSPAITAHFRVVSNPEHVAPACRNHCEPWWRLSSNEAASTCGYSTATLHHYRFKEFQENKTGTNY